MKAQYPKETIEKINHQDFMESMAKPFSFIEESLPLKFTGIRKKSKVTKKTQEIGFYDPR